MYVIKCHMQDISDILTHWIAKNLLPWFGGVSVCCVHEQGKSFIYILQIELIVGGKIMKAYFYFSIKNIKH